MDLFQLLHFFLEWERIFTESLVDNVSNHKQLSIQPSELQEFVKSAKKVFDNQVIKGNIPILTSTYTRPYIRSAIGKVEACNCRYVSE